MVDLNRKYIIRNTMEIDLWRFHDTQLDEMPKVLEKMMSEIHSSYKLENTRISIRVQSEFIDEWTSDEEYKRLFADISTPETDDEYNTRIAREKKNDEKKLKYREEYKRRKEEKQKKEKAELELKEKKEYERLRKKFEGIDV